MIEKYCFCKSTSFFAKAPKDEPALLQAAKVRTPKVWHSYSSAPPDIHCLNNLIDNTSITPHSYLINGVIFFMVPINYLAVILSAVVAMGIGFAWYGPLFGKKWSELMGWGVMTPEKMAEMQKKARPAYAISFVGSLLMAYVLAHSIVFAGAFLNVTGIAAGLQAAIWSWLGFVAPVTIGTVLWDGKPWMLWVINAGYYLVLLLAMGIILGLWV
jgi:hypothetical protein